MKFNGNTLEKWMKNEIYSWLIALFTSGPLEQSCNIHIADSVVNYGISNTIVLEIP